MKTLKELSRLLNPENTILLFGAGSSVPSGGPATEDLTRELQSELADGEDLADNLRELASIIQMNRGRRPLIEAVRRRIKSLTPTGGLSCVSNTLPI